MCFYLAQIAVTQTFEGGQVKGSYRLYSWFEMGSSAPKTVEGVYKNYEARRGGIVKALTSGNDIERC